MLMVIFGAGASYDSVSSFRPGESREYLEEKFRPPLAKELFHRIGEFRSIVEEFPRCREILNRLEPSPDGTALVEDRLEQLQTEAETYKVRHGQLLSVRYYLRKLISICQERWLQQNHGYTNYEPLLDYVRRQGPACLVTFNYDTMIEQAFRLSGRLFERIEDYILDPQCPLIKLHGSIDWENQVEVFGPLRSAQSASSELISIAEYLGPLELIRKEGQTLDSFRVGHNSTWIPALAIPVVKKSNFMCPKEHLQRLQAEISKVTKVLVIGWRASEQHFLELLTKGISKSVYAMAVCGTMEESNKTLCQLQGAGVKGEFLPFGGGFSDFLQSAQVDQFLAGSSRS